MSEIINGKLRVKKKSPFTVHKRSYLTFLEKIFSFAGKKRATTDPNRKFLNINANDTLNDLLTNSIKMS